MSGTMLIILIFVVCTVLVIVVGFIGNKAVDGAENAARAKQFQKRQAAEKLYVKNESLAARYENYPAQPMTQKPTMRQPITQQPIAPQTPQKAVQPLLFCARCGKPLTHNEAVCPDCGTPTDKYTVS